MQFLDDAFIPSTKYNNKVTYCNSPVTMSGSGTWARWLFHAFPFHATGHCHVVLFTSFFNHRTEDSIKKMWPLSARALTFHRRLFSFSFLVSRFAHSWPLNFPSRITLGITEHCRRTNSANSPPKIKIWRVIKIPPCNELTQVICKKVTGGVRIFQKIY